MKILSSFLNIIYPPRCNICGDFLHIPHENPYICETCIKGFKIINPPICSICGIPFESDTEEDHPCERCIRKRPFYDRLRALYLYENGIMEAVHKMKYSGKSYIAKSLAPLLASFAMEWLDDIHDMLMVPVPLHPRKLRQRGFNQSLILARGISLILNSELDILSFRRIKFTRSQTGLNMDERRKNVKNAFELKDGKHYKGKSVILVDDVATTGNTMNECARILKKGGCEKVYGLVLARTAAY